MGRHHPLSKLVYPLPIFRMLAAFDHECGGIHVKQSTVAGCDGKRTYLTWKAAGGDRSHVYRCRCCGLWHRSSLRLKADRPALTRRDSRLLDL